MKHPADYFRRCVLVAAMFAGFALAIGVAAIDAQTPAPAPEPLEFSEHQGEFTGLHGPVRDLAFSPDGKRIASVGEDRKVRVWGPVDGRELLVLAGHAGQVGAVAFSPDGKWLASGSNDQSITIWDAANGKAKHSLLATRASHVLDLAYSPDGTQIAAVYVHSRTVIVWDVERGKIAQLLDGPREWCESVAFSPDGKWLAAGGQDGTVQLWDFTTGRESQTLQGHKSTVRGLSFSPDSKLLASGGVDQSIRIWNVATGREILRHKVGGMLFDVAFSPDGKRVAAARSDATVSEFDVASGRETFSRSARLDAVTARLQRIATNFVYAVAYRPDGKQLAAASTDGIVRVWNLTP